MDYKTFEAFRKIYSFDEIKPVGADICTDNGWVHIVGLTRREHKMCAYLLDMEEKYDEYGMERSLTVRESMKKNMEERESVSVRHMDIGGVGFDVQSVIGGNPAQQESVEPFLIFHQMMEAGWRISEESPFYTREWSRIRLMTLELEGECERLPDRTDEISITCRMAQRSHILQIPVKLERGSTSEHSFTYGESGEAVCYINKVDMMDPREEIRKIMDEPRYRKMALEHLTQEEFDENRRHVTDMVEKECPEGMGYFVVEYECSNDRLGMAFYAADMLDRVPEPSKNASATFWLMRPEIETGPHGGRSRCAVIQYLAPLGTKTLYAELFSAAETFPDKTYHL